MIYIYNREYAECINDDKYYRSVELDIVNKNKSSCINKVVIKNKSGCLLHITNYMVSEVGWNL